MKGTCFACVLLLAGLCYLVKHKANASCLSEIEQKFIKVPQDGLAPASPFKSTTVTSTVFCSFDCAAHTLCGSFVFLKQKTLNNCLLSSDPNGGGSSEDSETFRSATESSEDEKTVEVCNHNKCQKGSKCVPSCSPPFYACLCPSWAKGVHCENLDPAFSASMIPWTRQLGHRIKHVDGWYDTWCTTTLDAIFTFGSDKAWERVPGSLRQISVGESEIWGVAAADYIYYRTGRTSSDQIGTEWTWDPTGGLDQISTGNTGIVWGVYLGSRNQLYYRSAGSWTFLDSPFKWVSCGKYGCWAVKTNGLAYFRSGVTASTPGGTGWEDTGGSFKQIDCGPRGEVYAVNDGGQVYTREGISDSRPEGMKWSQFGTRLFTHVSVGDKYVMGGGFGDGGLFYTLP